jgi:hypothetical protein
MICLIIIPAPPDKADAIVVKTPKLVLCPSQDGILELKKEHWRSNS